MQGVMQDEGGVCIDQCHQWSITRLLAKFPHTSVLVPKGVIQDERRGHTVSGASENARRGKSGSVAAGGDARGRRGGRDLLHEHLYLYLLHVSSALK